MIKFKVNDTDVSFNEDPTTPLLWVIREKIGLTGTKFGCGAGLCGACSLHLNGSVVRSCVLPVAAVNEQEITTIEGLSKDASHPVQKAWQEVDVPQCGYCQSGMIMAATSLLNDKPHATDEEISNAITNLCRCGTYQRIREAIHLAKSIGAENE
ncbi:(2Fe-2S)-binding protein [Thalassotalea atypica]|uniref:(2Fe-2S)-binding protein n=1 Tax=Thalassotalea atypica TaxID=2054316 RepID=UPI002572E6B6|nr:(2Fe-2S)-binding protein [Thalassotalea atypica]